MSLVAVTWSNFSTPLIKNDHQFHFRVVKVSQWDLGLITSKLEYVSAALYYSVELNAERDQSILRVQQYSWNSVRICQYVKLKCESGV